VSQLGPAIVVTEGMDLPGAEQSRSTDLDSLPKWKWLIDDNVQRSGPAWVAPVGTEDCESGMVDDEG
jgi:hypothetical protein